MNIHRIPASPIAPAADADPRRTGPVYLAGGLAGQAAAYHWQPLTTGAGSSDAVAGLIGALTTALFCDRAALPSWPAYLYTAHFAVYLTVLDATGFQLATLAGGAALAVGITARRRLRPRALRVAAATVVIGGAVAMTAAHDAHGVGLISLALGAVTGSIGFGRSQGSPPAP